MKIPFHISFYDADLDDGTEYFFGFVIENPSAIVIDDLVERVGYMEAAYGTQDLVSSDLTSGICLDSYEVEQSSIKPAMNEWQEWFARIGAVPGPVKDISGGSFSTDADVLAALV